MVLCFSESPGRAKVFYEPSLLPTQTVNSAGSAAVIPSALLTLLCGYCGETMKVLRLKNLGPLLTRSRV